MQVKTLAFSILGLGCVVAAAGGGYLAVRQNVNAPRQSVDTTATPVSQPDVTPAAAPALIAQDLPSTARTSLAPKLVARAPEKTASGSRQDPKISPATQASAARPDDAAQQAATEAASATPPSTPPTQIEAPPPPPPDFTNVPPAPDGQKVHVFEDLTVRVESVIGIRLETTISSETAKIEDRVDARVTRDVTVNGHTAIPVGARLEGFVTLVQAGGKFKDQARLGIRFNSIILNDGTLVPIQTETIYRDAEAPAGAAVAKVGGTSIIGGILGAVLGGKKGVAVGTAAGAAGGTAAVASGDANQVVMSTGADLTVRLTAAVTVTVEKE